MSAKSENEYFIKDTNPGDFYGNGFGFGIVYGLTNSKELFPVTVFARVTEKEELEKMKKACNIIWRRNGQKTTVRKSE